MSMTPIKPARAAAKRLSMEEIRDHRDSVPVSPIIPFMTPSANEEVVYLTPAKGGIPDKDKDSPLSYSPQLYESDDEFLPDITDIVFNNEDEEVGLHEHEEGDAKHFCKVQMSKEEAINAKKSLVFNDCLLILLKCAVGETCYKCQTPIKFKPTKIGTCLLVKWSCPKSAKGESHSNGCWASQPYIAGMYAGNILTSTSLILSGNNYAKVALMADFLNLNFLSESTHYRIQSRYAQPAVNEYWETTQAHLLQDLQGPVVLAGDGRNDSPGHKAKYLTYSLMDVETSKILSMAVVDCRETGLNSVVMEKVGFTRAIAHIQSKVQVTEVVTDAHPQIMALMKKDVKYQNMVHQCDVWHASKNITKKLVAAGKERGMGDLTAWIPSIKNHLWYCARTCGGDSDKLRRNWATCLSHVCNKHTWLDFTGRTNGRCNHPIPLPPDEQQKPWLEPGSKVHKRLTEILLDKQLLKKMEYLRNFRHTGQLELFHSHLLMYCPKRLAFKYPNYLMRNQLAALDFNHHVDRQNATDKEGELRYRCYYSKATKNWSAVPAKEAKSYTYIKELIQCVYSKREEEHGEVPIATPHGLHDNDPSRLQPTIAAVPKPPKAVLVERHQSRFLNN